MFVCSWECDQVSAYERCLLMGSVSRGSTVLEYIYPPPPLSNQFSACSKIQLSEVCTLYMNVMQMSVIWVSLKLFLV